MAYAQKTEVGTDRSKAEIEKTLTRYGAEEFGYLSRQDCAVIAFRIDQRHVRITLPLPVSVCLKSA